MDSSEMVKEMIKSVAGEEAQIDEPTCLLWKADHKDCKGCPSGLPCSRMVAIMMVMVKETMYKPKDFEDFNKTLDATTNMIDKILHAKTEEELHSIT